MLKALTMICLTSQHVHSCPSANVLSAFVSEYTVCKFVSEYTVGCSFFCITPLPNNNNNNDNNSNSNI